MKIEIDPGNEPSIVLRALAVMFNAIAGEVEEGVAKRIAAEDRPDTGASRPELGEIVDTPRGLRKVVSIEQFQAEGADLKAAFGGAGNVVGGSLTAPSPPPVPTGATSLTIPIPNLVPDAANPAPDLAAAFGGNKLVPNVAPLTPPAGTPPVPNSGVVTGGASTLDLDADGLPWNAEIHSSNKKKAATGKWMARRNVADATLERVTAQLRAAMSVGGNVQPPAGTPPPPPLVMTPTPAPSAGTTTGAGVSNGGVVTMAMLLPRVTTAIDAGQITADMCAGILSELSGGKVSSVAMLAIAPNLIPAFWQKLNELGVS